MTMPSYGPFSERKAAQVAAFFLHRAGGELPVLKLIKLMYLAERLSYERYGEPIVGDDLWCLPHGPILSATLNLMSGMEPSADDDGWEKWICARAENNVALVDPTVVRSPEQDLLDLSESDLDLLQETWEGFGHWSKWRLRDYTHRHCPEWTDPHGSRSWIDPQELLQHLKYSNDQARVIAEHLTEQAQLAKHFEEH